MNSQFNYRLCWESFVQLKKDAEFYVNPKPEYFSDICLSSKDLRAFLNYNILNNYDEFWQENNVVFSRGHERFEPDMKPDAFLSALVYVN
jgi:hypothetical protein